MILILFCDSRGIQTHNLLIRSQMLYSVELGSLPLRFCGCKGTYFFCNDQNFLEIFSTFYCFLQDLPFSIPFLRLRNQ